MKKNNMQLMYIVLLSMQSPVIYAAAMYTEEGFLFDEIDCSMISSLSDSYLDATVFSDAALLRTSYAKEDDVHLSEEETVFPALSVVTAGIDVEPVRTKRQRPRVNASSDAPEIAKPVCLFCGKHFAAERSLKAHIKSVHEEEKHQCPICTKNFTQKGNLNTHIKSLHEGSRYQCPSCGERSFKSKNGLGHHIRSMHEAITYPCELCNKDFTQKKALRIHIKSVHKGEKQQCPLCEKYISTKGNLIRHIKSKHPEIDSSSKKQRGNG